MKYEVIEAGSCEELKELVEDNMKTGWLIKGGVSVDNGMFYQAIGHPSDGAEAKTDESTGDACGVCGEVGCTNKVHRDIEAMAAMMKEFSGK